MLGRLGMLGREIDMEEAALAGGAALPDSLESQSMVGGVRE
jgi:hypothetical protein